MTAKRKTILLRFVRATGALLIGALVGWVSGPDFAELITAPWNALIGATLVPSLLAAEKFLRYGNDPGEDTG